MSNLSRREFVTHSLLAAAVMQLPGEILAQQSAPAATQRPDSIELHWLEGSAPAHFTGTTWGVPWPRGAYKPDQSFQLRSAEGQAVAVQTWPLAYWPDGSLKWTACAIAPDAGLAPKFILAPGTPPAPQHALTVREAQGGIEVDTGVVRCRIATSGSTFIQSIERDGKPIARDGQLVCLREDQTFIGDISKTQIEQAGPLRAVVKIEGTHKGPDGRAWLPFVLRLYFYAGGEAVRIMHTFVFDGEPASDFIRGLGVRFGVPMRDELHDRHARFAGEGHGLWSEAVRGLTGLRRDPGREVRDAQVAGQTVGPIERFPEAVRNRMQYVPAWNDYTLSQLSADGFQIRKRSKEGHGWIAAGAGRRAAGLVYLGGISGGVAFGQRDFWQRHPTQLDIRNAAAEQAQVTAWLWSPESVPMDLRFYHDGMGMQTHEQEVEGMNITYEDYEKDFGTANGIARTNELMLWALPATPPRETLVQMADALRTPALLACAPQHYVASKVFGGMFSVPDRTHPQKSRIEDQLDFLLAYYLKEVEQRRWYGFWDHGDVMHSYDPDRHTWRYDVGGFAWANSELSPDLWLWYSYLRSGRADVFRMAEAMTRHTGEVDVYHSGRFKGLGSRHNVQHWGCSAKQCRISTAANRRFLYFLTADERVGDLLREQIDSDQTFLTLDPIRKIRRGDYTPDPKALAVGFGTDWGSLAAAWLTEWERSGDEKCRTKLFNGMKSIAAMPKGFYSSGEIFYDMNTGLFHGNGDGPARTSHLSAVFGLPEICAELIMIIDMPEFEKAWLQYCEMYNAPAEEQTRVLGNSLGRLNLGEAHSRLTAYAAARQNDPKLAERAWREFIRGAAGYGVRRELVLRRVEGPDALNPLDEAPWVSTNASSQWGLTAIQMLAFAGDQIPESLERPSEPATGPANRP